MTATMPTITRPRAHAGQRKIIDDPARFKIVRCGRRFGKTTMGMDQTIAAFLDESRIWGSRWGPRIGWFTPLDRYTSPVFEELRERLSPWVKASDASKKTITLGHGAIIECWTMHSNPEAGRSRFYDLAVVDEAGLIPGLRKWFTTCLRPTLMDRKGRLLMLGTPHAIGPDFNDFYDSAATNEGWRAFTASTFDNSHIPQEEKDAILAAKATMPEWLWNQEYMGIPADTAAGIFGRQMLNDYIAEQCREPQWRGRIGVDVDDEWRFTTLAQTRKLEAFYAFDDPRGAWSVWGEPDEERGGEIVMGVDLSAGVGSSNTVISVAHADTGSKFAEFASPGVTPEEAARIAVAAGLFFGGESPAWIWFEANGGGGEQFGRELCRLRYPRIRTRGEERWTNSDPAPEKLGWWSTEGAKESMVLAYAADLKGRRFLNPSTKALNECRTYIYHKGRVVSVNAESDGLDELAGAPHGDRVIADALASAMCRWVLKTKPAPPRPPAKGGIHERIAESRKTKKPYGW